MYQRTSKYKKILCKPYTSGVRTEPHLEQNIDLQPDWEIPEIRRSLELTDFDSGKHVVSYG